MFNPNDSARTHHTNCAPGEIGRYVLLPGDPGRTDVIAQRLEKPQLIADNRELRTWTGYLDGVMVSVASTGMGCPSTAIAVEELIKCGADTIIRVGSCGRVCDSAYEESIDGFICTAAVRDEGTTPHYVPMEFPAVADRHVVAALADAAKKLGHNYMEGITLTKDSYYIQYEPDDLPSGERFKERWEAWRRANVITVEMETSALFVIASIRRIRAGAILNRLDFDKTISVSVEALRTLIAADQAQGK
ncbi:MAG: nucleoside phosphorylase [Oscillospiraceae bacterium]|nr:nucleoside phosphorylase [Oscillospiraceae bacterium]